MTTKTLVSRILAGLAVAFSLGADAAVRVAENAPLTGGVHVSTDVPRYFAGADGKAWIPIGLNICFSRTKDGLPTGADLEARRAEFEGWLDRFAAAGGNYVRLWLGHAFFEIMPEKPGEFDPTAVETLMRVVRRCERLGLKLKLTLESFRTVFPKGREGTGLYAAFFNRSLYAPYAANLHAFLHSERCYEIYMGKVRELARLGLGDSPAVIAWEPWNEIGCIGPWRNDVGPWSDRVMRDLRRMFPRQMTTQNLGSFSSPGIFDYYDYLCTMEGNDFLQVHRYLDCGGELDVCHGPMDVLAADAVRELRDRNPRKPVLLAEVGAVKPNHTGPSILYAQDREGTLLHDALFAPFFAGSAGCGQFWHWDSYVAPNGLWHHYARFAKAIEGLDPIAEDFRPFKTETRRVRVYGLRGKRTTVLWCRDKASDWRSELVEGNEAKSVVGEVLPSPLVGEMTCYLPWEDRSVKVQGPSLPAFRRSIVVRLPTGTCPFF